MTQDRDEAYKTTLDKYGVNEYGKSVILSKSGAKGGKVKTRKGFATDPEFAKRMSQKAAAARKKKLDNK